MDAERAKAPDLFRALELEPVPGEGGGAVPRPIDDGESDEITSPVEVREASRATATTTGGSAPAGAPKVPTGEFSGLADMLEPNSAPLMMPTRPTPEEVGTDVPDDAPAPARGSSTTPWVAVSLLLLGGLGYVLYTETDLFQGNVIELRDAKVAQEVEQEKARLQADAEANVKEYGSVQLSTTPDGARVFMLRPGPEATFDHLPLAGEYLVLVEAPGHVPRTRIVKGSELEAPVVMDLDPLEGDAPPPPVPEDAVPEPAPAGAKEAGKLVLKSSTEGARLGLLVGFTPGATVVDLDVRETYTFLVAKAGFEPHELVVKGRHYDEMPGGGLVYAESITLEPRPEAPETGGSGGAEGSTVGDGADAQVEEPPPPKKKKKKKKRRRNKRRK